MTNPEQLIFGKAEATILLKAGWGQAQVIRPTESWPQIVTGSFFVVCTQSCSVVSPDLVRDPLIEVAEATPVKSYRPRSDEARGKNMRKFHLAVEGAEFEALEVNINCRHFLKRELLLAEKPAAFTVSNEARREFAGWLSRYYSRIALPNELVSRLQKTILKKFKNFLEEKTGNPPTLRYEQISSMYVRFEPDTEITDSSHYIVDFMILCDTPEVSDAFDNALVALIGGEKLTVDQIDITLAVNTLAETFISDLRGWYRFTEWDYLSGMWETATMPSN